jgi:hypothetical protein
MVTMLLSGLALSVSGLVVLFAVGAVSAQSLEREVAKSLRVQVERTSRPARGLTVEGHVHNGSTYRIGSVRLRVETLDASNQVIGESFGWVYGNIKAGTSWPFSVQPAKEGPSFRVTVESFYVMARETPIEAP